MSVHDDLVVHSPCVIDGKQASIRMHLFHVFDQPVDVVAELAHVNEGILGRDTLVIASIWPVDDRYEMIVEWLVELLRDVISACVRFEAEIEFESRRVLVLTRTERRAQMQGIVVDAPAVALDVQARHVLQFGVDVQATLGMTVRDEPERASVSRGELLVNPTFVLVIGPWLISSTEQTVRPQGDFAVHSIAHRPIETMDIQKAVVDDGRWFIRPENPNGVRLRVRSSG